MRRLLAILIWSVVYFYASSVKIYNTWRMSVFHIRQWKKLLSDWRLGQWIIDTPNEYIFCTVLLLWIPIWLIGVLIIWRLLCPKVPTAHVIQKATASHPFIPPYTPSSMPSQGKSAVLSQEQVSQPEIQPADNEEKQSDWVPKDTVEAHALDVITQMAEENGLTAFPHVLLENELIPITISSDVDAFLIKVLAVPGAWNVSMSEPLEQSLWSCNGQNKAVLKEIIIGKSVLAQMEPESKVIPVVVLAQGFLENRETVMPWLNQRGIEVVTLPENQLSGIPQLSDILIKYFGPFETKEVQNEEQTSDVIRESSV